MSNEKKYSIIAPLLSIILMVLGNGVTISLTTWQLSDASASEAIIALVASGYYAGLLISSFTSQRFIFRVGHIRAYAVFAAIITVTCLLQGMVDSPYIWTVLRFINGYSLTGLIVVIESWLLGAGNAQNRGFILALYMASYYGAQSISQQILNIPDSYGSLFPFCVIAIFCTLSMVPLCTTRFLVPCPENPTVLSFKYMLKKVPLGVWGCLCSGMILGGIYSMLPHYYHLLDKPKDEVANILTFTILGGALLQYPIGHLSDRIDRRWVLFGTCLAAILLFVAMLFDGHSYPVVLTLVFFMGGATFAIYPLCSSHTIDNVRHDDIVSAISALMLAYGIGITSSPFIMARFMTICGPNGLLYYFISICGGLAAYTFFRIAKNTAAISDPHNHFAVQTQNTVESIELDPRVLDKESGLHEK